MGKTAESIKNQDYPTDKFSVIVVDGCSTDNTVGTIRNKLRNSNVATVFLSDKGRGLSLARQLVIENCSSKYIVWVDGDNVLPKNFLTNQVEYMENNPDAGCCGARIVPLGESIVPRLQGYQWTIQASDRTKSGYRVGKLGIQGVITRTKATDSVDGFDLSINGAGEDVDLFMRLKIIGWEIGSNDKAHIYHYMRDTWRGLWRESVWWGYGTYYLTTKHKQFFPSVRNRISFSILDGVKLTFKSLRVTKDLGCVIMPIHFGIRRVGFLVGHRQARRNKYCYQKK